MHRVLQLMLTVREWKHPVKWLYGALNQSIRESLARTRKKWVEMIGNEIEDKKWDRMVAYPQKV